MSRGVVLSLVEREEISRGLAAGRSGRVIAAGMGRHYSVISREIGRHGRRAGYRAVDAESRAVVDARRPRDRRVERDPVLRAAVNHGLSVGWSEQRIAARPRVDHPDDEAMRVSHESIYQAVCAQARGQLKVELASALRRGGTRRVGLGERRRITGNRQVIKDMLMITERPPGADDRAVPGHWEGDLIMGAGNTSAIITLVERTSRYTILQRVPHDHTAIRVAALLGVAMGRLPSLPKRSLAWGQGREMTEHASFTVATGIPVFFCDPHPPWQRGTNENTNALLRQCFPKGNDLSVYSQDHLDAVALQLNGRPRQTLGWLEPHEKLHQRLNAANDARTG